MIMPSHEAWNGLCRGIMGHKAMTWEIERVSVLFEPRYLAVTSNEIKFDSAWDKPTYLGRLGSHTTQRTTMFLRDVDYLIEARIALSQDAESNDYIKKFEDMFERRIARGQQSRQTYFGIRECLAYLELAGDDTPAPRDINQDLGIVYYGIDYARPTFSDADVDRKYPRYSQYFAPLSIRQGVTEYPSWPEVRRLSICRTQGGT